MKLEDPENAPEGTTRRSFNKYVAASLLAPPLAASLAEAQTPRPVEPTAPPTPQPNPAQQQPSPVAASYEQVARARFGEHIKPEQWEQLRKDLEGQVRAAERLRAFKLKNGDEPDFIFSAD
ncbi:MAG TPA: hypothetical protein VGB17_05640 [Pyrinomonadaceae bacterium]|jgi:hypothetical protein